MGHPEKQLKELESDYNFLKMAVTRQGFFKLYFKELPSHRTTVEAFNALNDRYFSLVGEYRYSNLQSFRNQLQTSIYL